MSTATVVPQDQLVDAQISAFELETEPKGALVLRETQAIEKIADESQYIYVCSKLREAAANIKIIEAYMQPHIDRAHAAHKRLTQKRNELTGPFELAKGRLGTLAGEFQQEQEKERLRLEEEARKQALAEQEKDRAVQAEQLAAEGRVEEGVAVLESPVVPIAITVAKTVPRVAGISSARVKYSVEVTDLKALVAAVAKGEVPLQMLKPDQSALDKMAGLLKETMNYPGTRLKKDTGVSVRA